MNILIVDDHAVTRSMLRIHLSIENPNANIETASSLSRAVGLIAITEYDYVISDLRLTDSDAKNTVNVLSNIVDEDKLIFISSIQPTDIKLRQFVPKEQDYYTKVCQGIC